MFEDSPSLDDDTDDDELTGLEEIAHGTNPLLNDTDADGAMDDAEVARGTDLNSPNNLQPGYVSGLTIGLAVGVVGIFVSLLTVLVLSRRKSK